MRSFRPSMVVCGSHTIANFKPVKRSTKTHIVSVQAHSRRQVPLLPQGLQALACTGTLGKCRLAVCGSHTIANFKPVKRSTKTHIVSVQAHSRRQVPLLPQGLQALACTGTLGKCRLAGGYWGTALLFCTLNRNMWGAISGSHSGGMASRSCISYLHPPDEHQQLASAVPTIP